MTCVYHYRTFVQGQCMRCHYGYVVWHTLHVYHPYKFVQFVYVPNHMKVQKLSMKHTYVCENLTLRYLLDNVEHTNHYKRLHSTHVHITPLIKLHHVRDSSQHMIDLASTYLLGTA